MPVPHFLLGFSFLLFMVPGLKAQTEESTTSFDGEQVQIEDGRYSHGTEDWDTAPARFRGYYYRMLDNDCGKAYAIIVTQLGQSYAFEFLAADDDTPEGTYPMRNMADGVAYSMTDDQGVLTIREEDCGVCTQVVLTAPE